MKLTLTLGHDEHLAALQVRGLCFLEDELYSERALTDVYYREEIEAMIERYRRENPKTKQSACSAVLALVLSLSCMLTCQAQATDAPRLTDLQPEREAIKGLVFISKLRDKDGRKYKLYTYKLLTDEIFSSRRKLASVPDLRTFDDRHPKIAWWREALGVGSVCAQVATPFVVGGFRQ